MKSEDSTKSSVGRKMCKLKLYAIERAVYTDFCFLVGPNKDEAELVHCMKADLQLASEYFRALTRSPFMGHLPVYVRHIQPHIFKMVIRFLSTYTFEEILSLDDAVALAFVADEFLLDSLTTLCCEEIEGLVSVENVWTILNATCHVPAVAAACKKILSSETSTCISHPSFLEASQESLIFFLEMDKMNIKCERILLNACAKLANYRCEDGYEIMRNVIPHLRLLTLKHVDQLPINKYLTPEEKSYLSRYRVYKDVNSLSLNINPNTKPRGLCQTCLNIIPERLITTDHLKIAPKAIHSSHNIQTEYRIKFDVHHNITLNGIEIMTQTKNHSQVMKTAKYNSDRFDAANTKYDEHLVIKVYTIVGRTNKLLYYLNYTCEAQFNSWLYFKFDRCIVLPKGTKFMICIETQESAQYQIIPHTKVRENFKATNSIALKNCLQLTMRKSFTNEEGGQCWDNETDSPTCIVKSLSFE